MQESSENILPANLRDAIDRGNLFLRYQPIVDLRSGLTVGAEALLRWNHPVLGELSAVEVISAAERTGAIVGLGRHVLFTACAQARRWIRTGVVDDTFRMSVNVSPTQLLAGCLVETVETALGDMPGERLIIELTETALVTDRELAAQQLSHLERLGVHVALDDFGTGYSCLDLLETLPVHQLKIDRVFIERIDSSPSRAVVRMIAELGRSLGLEVVAEGIERQEQLEWLRQLGSRLGQGYLFAPPRLAAEWEPPGNLF